MEFQEAYRMARHLASLHGEPYVVSIKRSFFRSRWCAEPRWLYLSVKDRRRKPTFVNADSPVEVSAAIVQQQLQGERLDRRV